jgi:hypothetical protein
MTSFKALKQDLYIGFDRGDAWGSAMNIFFGVANELHFRDPEIVPAHWQYVPPGRRCEDPRDTDDYYYDDLAAAKTDDLIRFGNLMERYTRILDKAGESY